MSANNITFWILCFIVLSVPAAACIMMMVSKLRTVFGYDPLRVIKENDDWYDAHYS